MNLDIWLKRKQTGAEANERFGFPMTTYLLSTRLHNYALIYIDWPRRIDSR